MNRSKIITCCLQLFLSFPVFCQNSGDPTSIKYLDLVHHTHTDIGFTDHPMIASELQQRYLDIALDLALESKNNAEGERFCWTAEALDPFWRWWQEASEDRRKGMLEMIDNGQIDVNALPFHMHPFLNSDLWKEATSWITPDLQNKLKLSVGLQNDVNGIPRAAAMGLLDKNINHISMGINNSWGGPPFKLPTAFWWKMPDQRKIFVWCGFPYWDAYRFFFDKNWRTQRTAKDASNTQFNWPRENDLFPADEPSVRKAHAYCLQRIRGLIKAGYQYDFLILPFSNQWRCDNDGPYNGLVPFVRKWNELGLKPRLNLTTVSAAVKRAEKTLAQRIKTYEGEWLDWWAFGGMATPTDLQASRRASAFLKAAQSPLWGKEDETTAKEIKGINRQLCLYYEHTFATNVTSTDPYGYFNQGHLAEKAINAYRPYERARFLLAQRVRARLTNEPAGLYVCNTGDAPFTGWVQFDSLAPRNTNFKSVKDLQTGEIHHLYRFDQTRFWVSDIPAHTIRCFEIQLPDVKEIQSRERPVMRFDDHDWITSVQWLGMKQPLFTQGLADFMHLQINEDTGRLAGYHNLPDSIRHSKVKAITKETWAIPAGNATMTENEHSYILSQELSHPRLGFLRRVAEVFKDEHRVKIKVQFERLSLLKPEIFYLKFPFPETVKPSLTSNGGVPYAPYKDNLPNSCKDFFVVDSWVKFSSSDGTRAWSSIDAPLVNFGGHNFCSRIHDAPGNAIHLYAMVYNNTWGVNFDFNRTGVMTYEFDLLFDERNLTPAEIERSLSTRFMPPTVIINPPSRENDMINNRMNTVRVIK